MENIYYKKRRRYKLRISSYLHIRLYICEHLCNFASALASLCPSSDRGAVMKFVYAKNEIQSYSLPKHTAGVEERGNKALEIENSILIDETERVNVDDKTSNTS